MASIGCPIEMEPKTLSQGQIDHAREVAADVVQKMEPSEASNIFVEGMKPVVPISQMESLAEANNIVKPVDKTVENLKKALLEKPCQCLCNVEAPSSLLVDSPDNFMDALKEPLSAPF
ncbi:uncharacterized protein LOC116201164 [Punica granatum]|uniref:SMP domain-containing protein n=2 Tax=Punica granatum TaxID=22663 RepID=A0A218WV87_PUNGR|nr:uncharacterized protein LOC116201164 [Punica granatum]OWM76506.1 hypothetical protein CDL15_Pgr005470 [Punica granatum]PKI71019.1 hypothetical protein CRG98_008600 [Punica granatum]